MIRIVIADKHPVVRYGLKRSLVATGPFNIIGEASTNEELFHQLQRRSVDVLIGEMSLLGGKTFDRLPVIRKIAPGIAVIVFSMHMDDGYVIEALRRGAMAYFTKAGSLEELRQGIHSAVSGKQYVDSTLRPLMADQPWLDIPAKWQTLSPQESEVLGHIVDGKRTGEIAQFCM